jgi:hypothetical protein
VRLPDTVSGEVAIRRPVQGVYRFYRDFTNRRRFSARRLGRAVAEATYRWVVTGPLGTRVPVTITISEQRSTTSSAIRRAGRRCCGVAPGAVDTVVFVDNPSLMAGAWIGPEPTQPARRRP